MKEAKLIMEELDKNPPKGCRATLVGILSNGDEVKALTDSAGPQVVVIGKSIHLISPVLGSHQNAISRGRAIIAADRTDVYSNWTNLHQESTGAALCRVCMGVMAGQAAEEADCGATVVQQQAAS